MLKLPQTKIWVRRTEDWSIMTNDKLINQIESKSLNRPYANPNKYIQNVVLWNNTMNISYFAYRQEIKDIAFKSFSATKLKTIVGNFTFIDAIKNSITLPTDDDDWYHPNIADYTEECFQNPKIKMVFWQAWIYHLSKNSTYDKKNFFTFTERHGKWMASNGYAIRTNEFSKLHCHIRNRLDDYAPNEVIYIDKPLSIWVQNPASIWELQSFDLDIKLTEWEPIPKELMWAEEYIEKSYQSTQQIKKAPFGALNQLMQPI